MNLDFYKKLTFEDSWGHVFSHVRRTNPHRPGSPRDAFRHGISGFELYLWTPSPVEIPIEDLADKKPARRVGDRNVAAAANGPSLPAIVVTIDASGRIGLPDGAHRLDIVRRLGRATIAAYVGVHKEFVENGWSEVRPGQRKPASPVAWMLGALVTAEFRPASKDEQRRASERGLTEKCGGEDNLWRVASVSVPKELKERMIRRDQSVEEVLDAFKARLLENFGPRLVPLLDYDEGTILVFETRS